jgi:AcrR family transcriptional regulator
MATAKNKPRLRREDWIEAALDAIARGGLKAIAIEPLAARLGVTKGSFYAHFSSRDELVEAALDSWERSRSDAALQRFAQIADPAERLREMLSAGIAFSLSGEPSVHVSLLGELDDTCARAAVARVTDSRLRLLARSYRELGFPPRRARYRAELAYATYRGLLQMTREGPDRRLTNAELARFMTEVNSALVAGSG